MSACSLCLDTLYDPREPGLAPGCPQCLSVPVGEEDRALARRWFGFDMWEKWAGNRDTTAWWQYRPPCLLVPLYLRAGWLLGADILAQRVGVKEPFVLVWNPANRELVLYAENADWLWGAVTYASEDPMALALPALRDIPGDAPHDLQAARALTLCLEATRPRQPGEPL